MTLITGGAGGHVANAYVSLSVPANSTSTLITPASNTNGLYVECARCPGQTTVHTGTSAPAAGQYHSVGGLTPLSASTAALHRLGFILPAGQGLYAVNGDGGNAWVVTVHYRLM